MLYFFKRLRLRLIWSWRGVVQTWGVRAFFPHLGLGQSGFGVTCSALADFPIGTGAYLGAWSVGSGV